MDLLSNITWSFTEKGYDLQNEFNADISEYQKEIKQEKSSWNPTEIVIEHPSVDIVFVAWIDVNGLAENEILLEDEDFFDDERTSEFGLFQADIQARLHAENGKNFSALELMYKLDQQLKPKELGDDLFFEGLGSLESDGNIPKFYLFCGS
ncbi:hypothetical protein [Kaistella polysaccharea]|uniref:hypothetical protein n=1 Tax=Kaistella polysaccharea TaxID=2878534 RepID=UPI001CF413DF|nr:hypothetical protein [Kaistella polysaccharea]